MLKIITIFIVVFSIIYAAPAGDEVKVLPGWNVSGNTTLKSKMYSGLIAAGSDSENGTNYTLTEHYVFFESENEPTTDPLIVWTNGGPGADSYFGLFTELGPYYVDESSMQTEEFTKTGIPTLWDNKFSWNTNASLLILNSPPPVGYSFCSIKGQTGDGYSCGTSNDTKTAKHSVDFLENWVVAFPEYANHDLYLMGESYAGVYVPMLVQVIQNRSALNATYVFNKTLKGFAVGDGCVGTDVLCSFDGKTGPGPWYDIQWLAGHNAIPDKLYRQVLSTCDNTKLQGYPPRNISEYTNECQTLLNKVNSSKGGFFDMLTMIHAEKKRNWWGPPHLGLMEKVEETLKETWQNGLNDYPCGGPAALFKWLQTKEVKAAFHVAPDAKMFSGDNGVGFTYYSTMDNLLPWYKDVITNGNLRILIYNGDTDPAINTLTGQNWTRSLNITENEAWRPWTIDGKQYMGGSVTRYQGEFDFVTIRGAGHMVPQYKPKEAWVMVEFFLRNAQLPKYVKPTTQRSYPRERQEDL